MKSVPNQCLVLGPVTVEISGSTPAMGWYMGSTRGGIKLQSAIKANKASSVRPILPRKLCLKIAHPARNRDIQWNFSTRLLSRLFPLICNRLFQSIPDPWVKVGVKDIHYQIGNQHHSGDEQE
ncbi:hypothetical protein ES703_68149 [subsurface metagenome]